jgi:hypothetical protein
LPSVAFPKREPEILPPIVEQPAATAASLPIAGTPTHGDEPTREAAMAAFAK